MANLPKIEDLTKQQLIALQGACASFFPVEILGEGYQGSAVSEFSIQELGLTWTSRERFLEDILRITGQKDIRSANKLLDKYATESPIEVEGPANQTQTTPSNLDDLERERLKRVTSEEQAWARAKEDVERARQKLEEIKVDKDKKYYAKIKADEVKLSSDQQKAYETYKEYSKQDPQQAIKDLRQEINNRVGEDLKKQGFTDKEIEIATTETATHIVENFIQTEDPNYVPPTYQTAVLAHFANNSQIAGSDISESANNVATTHLLQYQMYKDLTRSAFGDDFANKVFGVDADKVEVDISETPQAGGMVVTPYETARSNRLILDEKNQSLDAIKGFGVDRAKEILLGRTGTILEQRIALLTPNSAAAKLLQSVEAKSLLFSTFGVGAPVKWEATNLIGRLALKVAPEYAPIISGAGKLTGINFGITGKTFSTGIKAIGGKIAGQATGKVVGQAAVQTGLKGFIVTIAAALGIATSWLTAGLSLILGWIASKIDWNKVGSWLKEYGPILLLGGGLLIAGPAWGLGLGLGGLLIARRFRLAAIGATLWGYFGIIGSILVIKIARPIIVAIVSLPILVALIMFIINSGAFIVPPKPYDSPFVDGGGIAIECTEEKGPVGIEGGLSTSPIATRAWEITFDLYQGFWCFWNRSPKAPQPYFPNDVLVYPPGYPELFDYALFESNPNPPASSGPNLFWCTWLPIKAYNENGNPIGTNIYSPDMYNDFNSRGKIIDVSSATPQNIVPGSVVFLHVLSGEDRINHVGVVYTVDAGGLTFVQSNGPLKMQSLTFSNGSFIDLPGIETIAFGLP